MPSHGTIPGKIPAIMPDCLPLEKKTGFFSEAGRLGRAVGLWVCLFLAVAGKACAETAPPTVLLISLDGFRWDYLEKYHPPNLEKLAAGGVRAKRMIPAFPSLTFPNHYTLVTGLWPEHHGIIGNTMFDPGFREFFRIGEGSAGAKDGRWWGGEPIWVTAEKQGKKSACMFWPGSEAEIAGIRSSIWMPYIEKTPMEERVDTVLSWLAATPRPDFITLYFHHVDAAGHRFGPDSPEVAEAVAKVDDAIGRLLEGIGKLGLEDAVNLIVVSDHGMTPIGQTVALSNYVDLKAVQVDFFGAVAGLRPKDGNVDALLAGLQGRGNHFRVYRREEIPERFHFRAHRRIPPVVLVADEGWFFNKREKLNEPAGNSLRAGHGYDPELASMGALFIAAGPAFRKGVVLEPFENIHVYNLLCAILGLKPAANDGGSLLLEKALAR